MAVKTKILIVDDHPMMREGLVQLIAREKDLGVCGEAEDAHQAIEAISKLRPDLILADITMPNKSGLEMIKDIQIQDPDLKILVISMHDESLYTERVLRAGARGYIMKQEGGKKIMEAIRHVLSGQIYVSPKMSSKLLEFFSGKAKCNNASPLEKLTDREFEVFQLIGKGLSTKEIAQKLHLSVKTVEVHRNNAKQKLELKSAAELLRYSVRWTESQNPS
jgi:DNA-binding NarL/FixJ family response regulator